MVVRDYCLLCGEKLVPYSAESMPYEPYYELLGLQMHPSRGDCRVEFTDAFGISIDLNELELPPPDPEPFFTQTHPLLEGVLKSVFEEFELPRLGGASTGRGWTNFSIFQRCPYAWKRKYVEKSAPLVVADIPGLSIGTLVHTFLALHYVNKMPDSVYKALTPEVMYERLRAQANPELVNEGWRLFRAYRLYYQFEELNNTFTPLAIEYDLRNPRTGASTRYDLVAFVEHERPGLLPGTYIVEHKTAQRFDSDTLEGWANDGEILGEVGDQVDAAAGRPDRVVSDLVFYIMGKVELGSGVDRMKAPHDKVVKAILHHIGVDKVESTRALLRDKALRHQLGEPLATGIPQWWKAFQTQFRLYWPTPEERAAEAQIEEKAAPAPTTSETPVPMRGRRRRRAVAF